MPTFNVIVAETPALHRLFISIDTMNGCISLDPKFAARNNCERLAAFLRDEFESINVVITRYDPAPTG